MQTIEITVEEATLIDRALAALQREMAVSTEIASIPLDQWATHLHTLTLLRNINALSVKVAAPFITSVSKFTL